jgi:hypothetical protein
MTSANELSWRSGEPRRLSIGDAGAQVAATPQAIADVLQSAIADLRIIYQLDELTNLPRTADSGQI